MSGVGGAGLGMSRGGGFGGNTEADEGNSVVIFNGAASTVTAINEVSEEGSAEVASKSVFCNSSCDDDDSLMGSLP